VAVSSATVIPSCRMATLACSVVVSKARMITV
jgi:hypothetical protein